MLAKVARKHAGIELTPEQEQEIVLKMMKVKQKGRESRRRQWRATRAQDEMAVSESTAVPLEAAPSQCSPQLTTAHLPWPPLSPLTPPPITHPSPSFQVESLNEKLRTVVQDSALEALDPNRPPSPAPQYDALGSRTNTREVYAHARTRAFAGDGKQGSFATPVIASSPVLSCMRARAHLPPLAPSPPPLTAPCPLPPLLAPGPAC